MSSLISNPETARIAAKLKAHAERYCFWEPQFEMGAELAAVILRTAATVENEAISKGYRPEQVEGFTDTRRLARETLDRWRIIPEGRVHLLPLDDQGRDMELRAFLEGGKK